MYVETSCGAMEAEARLRLASFGSGGDKKLKSHPNSSVFQSSGASKYPCRANFQLSSGKEGRGSGIRRESMLAGTPGTFRRDCTVLKNVLMFSGQDPSGREWQAHGPGVAADWSEARNCRRRKSSLMSPASDSSCSLLQAGETRPESLRAWPRSGA